MTRAGIHLRATNFIRDGSPAWYIDLRIHELDDFKNEVARLRAEKERKRDAAVQRLWDRFLFIADQNSAPEVLP